MSNITEFKTIKRRQSRNRLLKLAALLAAILMGTYLISLMINTPNFAGLSSVVDIVKGGPGFPIEAPGGKVRGMYNNGNGLVAVNETTMYFYNTSGKEVHSAQHRMGNPQVKTSGTMMLTYDRGSKNYMAYTRNNLLCSGKTENAIRCGDISDTGCIALAVQLETAQTQVKLLDENQRELYTWKSDNAVTALTLSENGKMLAIGSSFAEDGSLKNALTLLKNGKEQYRYVLENELILALDFDGNNVRCITDRNAILFSQEGKIIGKFPYKGQQLAGFAMYENGAALVFGNYEQDRQYILASLNKDFYTLNGTAVFEDNLQKVAAYGHTIMVLGTSSLNQYSSYDCSLLKEEVNESYYNSYYDILPMGKYIYAMTTTEIDRLPIEEPSKFSLFGGKGPQVLPGHEEEQSQEDMDILEEILSGFGKGEEPVIGESSQREEEIKDLISDDEETPQEIPEEPKIPEMTDSLENGGINQGPGKLPVENEDAKPNIQHQEEPKPSSGRRPASDDSTGTEKPKAGEEEKKESSRPASSDETKPEKSDTGKEKEPLFSSRGGAE